MADLTSEAIKLALQHLAPKLEGEVGGAAAGGGGGFGGLFKGLLGGGESPAKEGGGEAKGGGLGGLLKGLFGGGGKVSPAAPGTPANPTKGKGIANAFPSGPGGSQGGFTPPPSPGGGKVSNTTTKIGNAVGGQNPPTQLPVPSPLPTSKGPITTFGLAPTQPPGPTQPPTPTQPAPSNTKPAPTPKGSGLGNLLNGATALFGGGGGGGKGKGKGGTTSKIAEAADIAQLGVRASAGDPTAMVGLAEKGVEKVKERFNQVKEGAQQMGTGAANAFKSDRIGGIGKGFGEMGEGMGKMIGGPVGDAMQKVSKFGKVVFESVDKLRDWNNQLHEANMKFAEFSASMAHVQAEQEMRDMELSRKRGERRAESAQYLAEGKSKLEEAVTPWEDQWAIIKNWATGYFTDLAAEIIQPLTDIAKKMGILTDRGDEGPGETLTDYIHKQGAWLETFGRPPRFPPGT